MLREKNVSPKEYNKWTDEDKNHLGFLMNEGISVNDTILGKERPNLERERKKQAKTAAGLRLQFKLLREKNASPKEY